MKRLRELREAHRMTISEVARCVGASKQSVSNWEHGTIMPSIDKLLLLADLFQVSTDFLLGRDDRVTVDLTDLSLEEAAHVHQLISDLIRSKKPYSSITPPPNKRSPS